MKQHLNVFKYNRIGNEPYGESYLFLGLSRPFIFLRLIFLHKKIFQKILWKL